MKGKLLIAIILGALIGIAFLKLIPTGCTKTVATITYASFQVPPNGQVNNVPPAAYTSIVIFEADTFSSIIQNKTLFVYLPTEYVQIAGNIAYFLYDLDPHTKYSIAHEYFMQDNPMLPNSENYLMFSYIIENRFKYGNTNQFLPVDYLLKNRVGICQNYAKLWAAVALAEGKTATIYILVPMNGGAGHVFVEYDGMAIENNGHVYLNNTAALDNWYSALGPYSAVIITMYPNGVSFSISKTTISSPLVKIKRFYNYTITVTRTFNNKITTYTVFKNAFSWKVEECGKTYTIIRTSTTYMFVTKVLGKTIPVAIMGIPPLMTPDDNIKYALVYAKEVPNGIILSYAYITQDTTFTYEVTYGRSIHGEMIMIISSNFYQETYNGVLS